MNEKTIQNALYFNRSDRGHQIIVPNIQFGPGEADLISITRAGSVYEHEIKISRADFKADFKHKADKHIWLKNAKRFKGESERLQKYKQGRNYIAPLCANYFYYVVPADLVKLEEIPAYAGLMFWSPRRENDNYYLHRFGSLTVIKEAPRLHSTKITEKKIQKIAVSMMFRYWRYRLKTEGV